MRRFPLLAVIESLSMAIDVRTRSAAQLETMVSARAPIGGLLLAMSLYMGSKGRLLDALLPVDR